MGDTQKVVNVYGKAGIAGDVLALMQQVNREKPDPKGIARLRELLASDPAAWEIYGNLNTLARNLALQAVPLAKAQTLADISVAEGEQRIRHGLGFDGAPMLERLLIEQIVTCWVRVSVAELLYSHINNGSQTLAKASYWDKHLEGAQRRYLRAIEALARVRRLKLPAVQVNVAQSGARQLNVATSGGVQPETDEGG